MERLFVYGSLQPGGTNAHVLADVGGYWERASVRGRLLEAGWGMAMGYPGLVLDAGGGEVPGHVLASPRLHERWAELDSFEGDEYERRFATVTLRSGECVRAHVYVVRRP